MLAGVRRARIAFALVLVLLTGCKSVMISRTTSSAARSEEPRRGAAAQFDFYLLNLSWSPEFCYSHPSAAECGTHSTFVLHGLWPQNNDGSYPRSCSSVPGPADPSQYGDLYADASLLEHEWKAHGTCSGLSPDAYFAAARKAMRAVVIPPQLARLNRQISMPPDQILDLFTASNPQVPRSALALSCGNNYLTAVEECLDKTLRPIACSGVRSCRANTVRIPPP